LSGEEVTLYADVNKASHDAIKFSSLFLLVEAQNSASDNKTMNGLLEKFWVKLVYSGKSEYRLKGEIYYIDPYHNMESDLILMQGYGCKHSCLTENESNKMLSGNKPILSPYTLWKMKFESRFPNSKEDEKTLKKIGALFEKNHVVVSLSGKGQYISKDHKELDMSCDGDPLSSSQRFKIKKKQKTYFII